MDQQAFLLQELEDKIGLFQDASKKHKDLHRLLRYCTFGSTALLSVLSGLALYFPDYSANLNIAILGVSALAGIVASLEGLRKADELWLHERTTYYVLLDLKRSLEFEIMAGALTAEQVAVFFNRLQEILANSGERWSQNIVREGSAETEGAIAASLQKEL